MKLALITDAPRESRKSSRRYIEIILEYLRANGAGSLEWDYVPVVPTWTEGSAPGIAVLKANTDDLLKRLSGYHAAVSFGVPAASGVVGETVKLRSEFGRMRWLDLPGSRQIPWLPNIDPLSALKNPDLHRDFSWALEKIVMQPEPFRAMDIDLVVVHSIDELTRALTLLEDASVIGVDVETTGLSNYRDDLIALGLGAIYDEREGVAVIVPESNLHLREFRDTLRDWVWSKKRRAVGHNFKFDMGFLEPVLGWPSPSTLIGDTLLLQHLLDERPNRPDSRARGSGLKDLVAQRYDLQYGFEGLGGEIAEDRMQELHEYLGRDVCYTALLWHDLENEALDEDGIMNAHEKLLMPVSKAVAKCEWMGAPVDREWVEERARVLRRRIAKRETMLLDSIARITPTSEISNVNSPTQVQELVFSDWGWHAPKNHRGNARSTAKDALDGIIAIHPGDLRGRWLRSLIALRHDAKTLKTYEGSMLERMDSDDRLRASFLLHGASTGRISSREPNLQNIPAVGRGEDSTAFPMRRAFAPPDGRLWVEADYSQLELRVAAALSQDEAFMQVFQEGRDIHMEVACAILSKTADEVSKAERFIAKSVSFGIIYGRSAGALASGVEMDYAERELGMKRWTEEQAQLFIRKFLRSYPRLQEWINEMHVTVEEQKWVGTPFGRRRRFPMTPRNRGELGKYHRQAVNTPVQSVASDLCLEALVRVQQSIADEKVDAVVLFPVHDSICIEVAPDEVERLEKICRRDMEEEYMGVPLEIDFEYGPSWAETKAH